MASPKKHTLPPSSISDVMSLLKEILTKLTRLEDDNRKLRQELHEIKSYQKLNDTAVSKKRDKRDDEAEHKDENSNNKKARVSVSVASLPSEPEPEPEPEPGHVVEPPASFDTLDDDCIGNILDFVGKKSYSVFGLLNKNCHEIFCSKGLPKETYRYGYAPLLDILQGISGKKFKRGVLHFNRMDLFDWILGDEHFKSQDYLKYLCDGAIEESRLDILRKIFQRANEWQLECLRAYDDGQESYYEDEDGNYHDKILFDLCSKAAECGKTEIFKFLIENECDCDYKSCDYLSKAVLDDDRKDMFEWMLASENKGSCHVLKCLCVDAIRKSRSDILREVFQRANKEQLEYLRGDSYDCYHVIDLCYTAAKDGKLECLKFLRENECRWNGDWGKWVWREAKQNGHDHILDYLRNNSYPTEWQN